MWLKLKQYFHADFIITNVLVPMIALILYFGAFAFMSTRYIPVGVNVVFVNRMWGYLWILFGILYLALFFITKIQKNDTTQINHRIEKVSISDLLLLFFPLTPVAQYLINNQEILSFTEALSVLIFFTVFSIFFIFVIPLILGIIGSTRTMKSLGLAFVFTITNMASLTSQFNWFENGSLKIQVLFLGATFIIVWILNNRKHKQILYLFVVVSFVISTAFQWLSQSQGFLNDSTPLENENKLRLLVEGKKPVVTPNVYLLVYESYVANETMLGYGIDNGAQEAYLVDQGFILYPHTYSVGTPTLATMSRVFNVSTEYYGDPRRGVSGDGIVHNIFRNLGYKNYGLFWSDYYFRGIISSYDFSTPDQVTSSDKLMIEAILMGEFKFDIGYDKISYPEFRVAYQSFFNNLPKNPFFVYMHNSLPGHSQNSGVCRPDETELYQEGLSSANLEMKQVVQLLVDKDPSAIIIIAGDHGPYLTKNCYRLNDEYDHSEISRLDFQDRYGTFLAIRWPTDDYDRYDDIVVLQDLFSAVFAYLYNDEIILESKIEPIIVQSNAIGGLTVNNGVIVGGMHDNEPLFLSDK